MSEAMINTGWCAIPEGTIRAWTFRAIHNPYKRVYMDLLSDRQSWYPGATTDREFKAAVDSFIQVVREETKTMKNQGSLKTKRIAQNGVILTTFVRESGGYLYGAFFETDDKFVPDASLDGRDRKDCSYNLRSAPDGARWVSEHGIPNLGDHVLVTMNGLGKGVVTAYFAERGFLGVQVHLFDPPEWYTKQHDNYHVLVYGPEVIPCE